MNILKLLYTSLFLILIGCSSSINSKVIDGLTYNVFNYSKDYYGNIRVNNSGIANVDDVEFIGSYEGSGEYCCISVDVSKNIVINYDLIKGNSKPLNKNKEAIFFNNSKKGSNLILHILPNENFVIEITDELPEPSQIILDEFLKKNKIKRKELDDPSSWRLIND